MAIKITCGNCGLSLPEEVVRAGTLMRCTGCGEALFASNSSPSPRKPATVSVLPVVLTLLAITAIGFVLLRPGTNPMLRPPVAEAAPPLPATNPDASTGPFVDREGNPIAESDIPQELTRAAKVLFDDPRYGLKGGSSEGPLPDAALVLCTVSFPPQENNHKFSSTLIGRDWYGGLHYLSDGGIKIAGENPGDTSCIRLIDFAHPCRLQVAKAGYQTVDLAVPTRGMQKKIIWMGTASLQPVAESAKVSLKGTVLDLQGKPLDAPGKATIRINGSTAFAEASLDNGRFEFPKISPGSYLVEFWIDGYSTPTWFVNVPAGGSVRQVPLIAVPKIKLTVQLCGTGTTEETVECGVAYKDAYLSLEPEIDRVHVGKTQTRDDLRVDQSGQHLELYSALHKVVVVGGPYVDQATTLQAAKQVRAAWFSWNGNLSPGQLIVLIDDSKPEGAKFGVSASATILMTLEVKAVTGGEDNAGATPSIGHPQ